MASTDRSTLPNNDAVPGNHASAACQSAVHSLASELQVPVGKVAGIYAKELAELHANARVTAFISILAVKRVRDALRQDAATLDNATRSPSPFRSQALEVRVTPVAPIAAPARSPAKAARLTNSLGLT